jgi:hypothetical protein
MPVSYPPTKKNSKGIWNLEPKAGTVAKIRRKKTTTPLPIAPTSENAFPFAPPPYSCAENNKSTHIDIRTR